MNNNIYSLIEKSAAGKSALNKVVDYITNGTTPSKLRLGATAAMPPVNNLDRTQTQLYPEPISHISPGTASAGSYSTTGLEGRLVQPKYLPEFLGKSVGDARREMKQRYPLQLPLLPISGSEYYPSMQESYNQAERVQKALDRNNAGKQEVARNFDNLFAQKAKLDQLRRQQGLPDYQITDQDIYAPYGDSSHGPQVRKQYDRDLDMSGLTGYMINKGTPYNPTEIEFLQRHGFDDNGRLKKDRLYDSSVINYTPLPATSVSPSKASK